MDFAVPKRVSLFLSFYLQCFSEKHPESASRIKLTMAQLYLTQGLFLFLCCFLCVTHNHMKHFQHFQFTLFSCLLVGHVTKACDILRSIEDFKHKQGMVRFAVLSSPILCSFKKVAEIICEVTYLCHAGFCPGHNVHT